MRTFVVILFPFLVYSGMGSDYPPPQEPYTLSWIGGPFVWPSAVVRNMYKETGKFIPNNTIATRAAIFRDDVYVTFPRFLPGVPATLARTSLLSFNYEAVFEPFPSWEAQMESNCDALQNAVDLFIDRRDILWVLDTGVTQTLAKPERHCPPKAVGFDLITGKQKYKVDLSKLATPSSRLQYIVVEVDTRGLQDRRYLYINDAAARALFVYNLMEESGYRVVLPECVASKCPRGFPDVLYLTLNKMRNGERKLFLTSLCGGGVFSIPTSKLKNGTDKGAVDLVSAGKPEKMVIIGGDNMCNLYFRYEGKGDVYTWDVNSELLPQNIRLVHSGDCCLLATHAVLDPLRGRTRILESNFMDFLHNSVGVGAIQVLLGV